MRSGSFTPSQYWPLEGRLGADKQTQRSKPRGGGNPVKPPLICLCSDSEIRAGANQGAGIIRKREKKRPDVGKSGGSLQGGKNQGYRNRRREKMGPVLGFRRKKGKIGEMKRRNQDPSPRTKLSPSLTLIEQSRENRERRWRLKVQITSKKGQKHCSESERIPDTALPFTTLRRSHRPGKKRQHIEEVKSIRS